MRRAAVLLVACVTAGALAGASPAFAQGSAWWHLSATPAPTLLPRTGPAQFTVTASDLGDREVNATREHVTISDTLPAGVLPVGVEGVDARNQAPLECAHPGQTVTCTFTERLAPYESLFVRIHVQMQEPQEPLQNVLKLKGGETLSPKPLEKTLELQKTPGEGTPFGIEDGSYELTPEAAGGPGEEPAGTPDLQAGSHPFQLTTTFDFNQTLAEYHAEARRACSPLRPRCRATCTSSCRRA